MRLIKVTYEVLPPLATIEQSRSPNAPAAFPKGNVSQPEPLRERETSQDQFGRVQ